MLLEKRNDTHTHTHTHTHTSRNALGMTHTHTQECSRNDDAGSRHDAHMNAPWDRHGPTVTPTHACSRTDKPLRNGRHGLYALHRLHRLHRLHNLRWQHSTHPSLHILRVYHFLRISTLGAPVWTKWSSMGPLWQQSTQPSSHVYPFWHMPTSSGLCVRHIWQHDSRRLSRIGSMISSTSAISAILAA